MSEFVIEALKLNTEFVQSILDLNSQSPFYLLIYLIPSAIAFFSKKENLRPIFLFNMIAGFTGVAWFVIFFGHCSMQKKKNLPNWMESYANIAMN